MAPAAGPLAPGRHRDELVAEVAARLAHLRRGVTLVIACSGGPDSTALAHLTAETRPDATLVLVHVDHGLRSVEARRADRAVVATHASWLGAEVVVREVVVEPSGDGLEAAARRVRYAALRDVATARDAAAILVGHHAEDQAETLLLRLARGTGIDGLAGMATVAGDLVRPLLRLRRSDLLGFVAGEGLPTATDATNQDPSIRRVAVRTEVLPALERVAADPVGALGRLAVLAGDDAAALRVAAVGLPDALRVVGEVVVLRRRALATVPVAFARRLVRRAFALLGVDPPAAATVARILALSDGGAVTLPAAIEVRAERSWISLTRSGPRPTAEPVALSVPGRGSWPAAGLELRAFAADVEAPTDAERPPGPGQIALPIPGWWSPPSHHVDESRTAPGTVPQRYAVVLPQRGLALEVRRWGPGDRIRGTGGRRRVAELLREAGMPRAVRTRWPLLTVDGVPAWLPGVAADGDLLAAGRRTPGLAVLVAPAPEVALP